MNDCPSSASWLLPRGLDPILREHGVDSPSFADSLPCWIQASGEVRAAKPEDLPEPGTISLQRPGGPKLELEPGSVAWMGILNCTPDSFYDGARQAPLEFFLEKGRRMVQDGADILDLGGESTRPGAALVSPEEECARTLPVVEALRREFPDLVLSLDTRNAEVARRGLEAGVDWINDVSGLKFDPGLAEVVAKAQAPVVLMHMRGTPQTMKSQAKYESWPLLEILSELEASFEIASQAGIPRSRWIVDPGIGFAKDWRTSLECLRRLDAFTGLGIPVLVGASRKSLLGAAAGSGPDPKDRLPGTLALHTQAALRGAQILRVHDVAEGRQAWFAAQAVEAGLRAPDRSQAETGRGSHSQA